MNMKQQARAVLNLVARGADEVDACDAVAEKLNIPSIELSYAAFAMQQETEIMNPNSPFYEARDK